MTETPPDLRTILNSTAPAAPAAEAAVGGDMPPGPMGYDRRPGQTVCGDIDMRIDRDGTWHYAGSPIGRKELVALFATVLYRDAAGDHWLITPAEICRIRVDDAPFLAVGMTVEGSGRDQTVSLRTNLDKTVTLDVDHPLIIRTEPATGTPRPYVVLDKGLEARVTRAVYYQLADLAVAERPAGVRTVAQPAIAEQTGKEHIFGIWSAGRFFSIEGPDGEKETEIKE